MALTGIQIFKLLPKTNCKECGVPTCLAFATCVIVEEKPLETCPHLTREVLEELGNRIHEQFMLTRRRERKRLAGAVKSQNADAVITESPAVDPAVLSEDGLDREAVELTARDVGDDAVEIVELRAGHGRAANPAQDRVDQAALADIAATGKGNFRPIRCRTTFQGRSTGDKVCTVNMHQLNSRLLTYL